MVDPKFVPGTRKQRNDLQPRLEMVEVAIDDLHFEEPRLRPLKKKHAERIRRSILRLGNSVPIIIGPGNEVIDGQGRVDVARELGLSSMHCVRVDHLDAQELRLLRLSINKIAERYRQEGKCLQLRNLNADCRQLLERAGDLAEVDIADDRHYHITEMI